MAIDRVFLACAAFGGGLFLIRMALLAFGGGGGDADVDLDLDVDADFDVEVDAEAGAGEALADSSAFFRMLSVQSVTAFIMMFGLVGLTLRKEAAWGPALSIVGALLAGAASFWLIARLVALLLRLQSSGNVRLSNAIGLQGSVYLTIPRAGVGQIQAVVQQRLTHVDAVARDGEPIATGERVTIVGIGSDNRLIVERVQDGAEGAGSNGRQ
ncbi:MAG: hypothetical protein GXY85_01400 [Candidatus Brocadiaceae bacterium]|nr:hypothetical protein [Candidatus Brocadiaceae bacterium]